MKIHGVLSSTIVLNTGSPQECVLSLLLYTYDYSAKYPGKVGELVVWCKANNLCINVEKTQEMVVDFRIVHTLLPSSLDFTGYLGLHISSDLE